MNIIRKFVNNFRQILIIKKKYYLKSILMNQFLIFLKAKKKYNKIHIRQIKKKH